MLVIGKADNDTYLCKVDHSELEKFMGLYYGNMAHLKVGESVDLGKGHDFARQAADAMQKTAGFIDANKDVIKSIVDGVSLLGRMADEAEQERDQ